MASTQAAKPGYRLTSLHLVAAAALVTAIAAFLTPQTTWDVLVFVVTSLLAVAPLVGAGIVLAAWLSASGAAQCVAMAFSGRVATAVLFASAIGAITPVCGITVLPLMAGLLAGGVPLAPVMAFWLSSPVTDPAMLAATASMLGVPFAAGKTIAAFALGVGGGAVTAMFARADWYRDSLRRNALVGSLGTGCGSLPERFQPAIWREAVRRREFVKQGLAITRLVLICLIPAFAAEYLLNAHLQPEAVNTYIGDDSWWAIPLAVFVGAPAYINGYAALPLARSLIGHGMSEGAAMAFLVSGSVVSIWGALAIVPVLRTTPFLLYMALAIAGSLASGWLYAWVV